MSRSFTFNGIRKPWLYLLEGRDKPPFASVKRETLTITGMPGAYLELTEVSPLVINQPFAFIINSDEHALKIQDELAAWLITKEPTLLEFDDEPGRVYYAVVQNSIDDFDKFLKQRKGTIQFLCLDPYSYGEEQTYDFTEDAGIIENNGTAEADPIIELEAIKPVTFALVSNGDKYNMIGKPFNIDQVPTEKLTTILNNRMDNFTGWTNTTAGFALKGPLGGIVDGSFTLGNGQWMVSDYGSNPNGWHGPSKRTSFSESLQDFQVDFFLTQLNFAGELGKNVIYLLDEKDDVVASFGSVDKTIAAGYNSKVQFYLGGTRLIFDFVGFNNTQMWLRLKREGTLFTATAYQLTEDGKTYNTVTDTFEDRLGEYQAPIRQAAVYVATFKEYRATRMYVNRLKVARVNDLSENEVPYIAGKGDIITLDHVESDLRINGESRMDLKKSLGADFFKLQPGENSLAFHPSDAFLKKLRFRERFR